MLKSYQEINAKTIDRWVEEGWEWGQPISHETYLNAKNGNWNVLLTPTNPVPHEWFGNLKDKKIKKEMLLKTGMVFQTFNLFPHMSVRNNIVKTLELVKKMDKKEATKIAEETLEVVGLIDKIDNFPSELSGGQKQRVAIARALSLRPDILLFDEPTSALDPELVKEVLDIIRKLKNDKITMLIVSHEMNFVKEISDKVVVLEKGEILEKGDSKKIFENPDSQRVKEFLNTIY